MTGGGYQKDWENFPLNLILFAIFSMKCGVIREDAQETTRNADLCANHQTLGENRDGGTGRSSTGRMTKLLRILATWGSVESSLR